MLAAALAVLTDAAAPQTVTMDAVAAAAGVGKGTLFRAFGDRDGLLDALVESQFHPLRAAVTTGQGDFAADTPPARRVGAFLDAVLDFKLANRNLMLARETTTTAPNLTTERYRWMHGVLTRWIEQTGPAMSAAYAAHALLLLLQADVVDQLLSDGTDVEQLKQQQSRHRAALLGSTR